MVTRLPAPAIGRSGSRMHEEVIVPKPVASAKADQLIRRLLLTIQRFLKSPVRMHAVLGGIVLGLAGCDAFNPAFVNIVAPNVAATSASVPNPPGYVVVTLQNNVQIQPRLVDYLLPDLDLTPAERQDLRARIRLRLRITFVDGTFQVVEMISGSGEFVDPSFNAEALADLRTNTLTNIVVRCDVASVQLEPGTNIEVFIPVPLEIWEVVELENTIELQLRGTRPPQFQALQVDDVDEDGNVILLRNIDPRNVLSPIGNLICGTVVPVVVTGVLAVPFLDEAGSGNPSFDQDDENIEAVIGGRYQFNVSAR